MVTWALITNRRISLCLLSAGKVHLLPSGSVVLTDLDPSDTGNYTCVAVNPVSGHNRSATYVISLTVTPKSQGQCVVSDGRVSQARLVLTPVASVVVWSGWVRLGRLVLICQSRLVVSGRDSAFCGWVFASGCLVWFVCLVSPRLDLSKSSGRDSALCGLVFVSRRLVWLCTSSHLVWICQSRLVVCLVLIKSFCCLVVSVCLVWLCASPHLVFICQSRLVVCLVLIKICVVWLCLVVMCVVWLCL